MYQLNLFDDQRITSAKRDLLLKQALPCRQDTDLLKQSSAIITEAISSFNPYAIVAAVSGGDDSMAAYYVAKMLGVKLDFILHVNTRTGIPETTQFVRHFADKESMKYIEGDAGNAYESRVLEKGFFGLGRRAHNYAYHILKQRRIEHELSKIRERKRGRNILIINGVRKNESDNRRKNFADDVYRHDGSNIWVNLIHYWEKSDCLDFLADCKACRNPVSKELCRSGECMCGTMQSQQARLEAAALFPEWGQWLDELERKVKLKFPWGWGQRGERKNGWGKESGWRVIYANIAPEES
ncbi:MAG: phosphoadenosine phosphosulfate reductase family protein [Symploca sp. SIO2G7]|nr:phosphoadenosine phosphosulfate reductase family protein [Symploca sp. SIO2G7]